MSVDSCFIYLQPTTWVQSLHTERGENLRVNARFDRSSEFSISGVRSVAGLRTDLAFTRGKHDWKIPKGPDGARGFLAYHAADEHIECDFLSGGCSLREDIYDDVWHRVGSASYDQCRISIEVGPAELDYEDAVWDRTASKFLYILDLELIFTRKEKVPDTRC